eukprot:4917918-Amphidinium_carterae.1
MRTVSDWRGHTVSSFTAIQFPGGADALSPKSSDSWRRSCSYDPASKVQQRARLRQLVSDASRPGEMCRLHLADSSCRRLSRHYVACSELARHSFVKH